jgi:hypothetical protein
MPFSSCAICGTTAANTGSSCVSCDAALRRAWLALREYLEASIALDARRKAVEGFSSSSAPKDEDMECGS